MTLYSCYSDKNLKKVFEIDFILYVETFRSLVETLIKAIEKTKEHMGSGI